MPRRAGRLGWFLVWAVVYCDIGTSVFYVPGILWETDGEQAGFYVAATLAAFALLAIKVVDVTRRFPGGGGVVSVADRAFGPWVGCLGGQLIQVDYFLTVAISATAGVYYVDSLVGFGPLVLPLAVACVAVLAALNIVGLRESARVSGALAVAALLVNLVVIGLAVTHAPAGTAAHIADAGRQLGGAEPWRLLTGFAGAWLAFSGLESMAQLAPAMRDLSETPRRAMLAVVASVAATVPAITFLSLALLPADVKSAHVERFVSSLAATVGGVPLQVATVLTAAALLMLAANTAILGNYHVFLALTRRSFLPVGVAALSHRYQTPYRAILLSTGIPIGVILIVAGDITRLGELYAFGLLGAFVISSASLDVLRWRDGERGPGFALGVFTTALVLVAFMVNLVEKPEAAVYGLSFVAVGMVIAVGSRTGALDRVIERIPGLAPPRIADATDIPFHTLEKAEALERDPNPGILVASRGAAEAIFREAVERARSRGQSQIFLLYVDEVPGLFYPQLVAPTPEGLTVLQSGCRVIRELGLEVVPVWTVSHSAAGSVAEAAETLGCDTVIIGATQRTVIWQALRGAFVQDLMGILPARIRLVVVG